MSITSMIFLFCFLPVSLFVYYIAPEKIKESILLIISFIFYAMGSLDYIMMFIAIASIDVFIGRTIAGSEKLLFRKALLSLGIIINVSVLVYYKYTNFILITWNNINKTEVPIKNIALPLGISFFTFKAISYLIDVYKKSVELSDSFITDALYLSFFSQIQSGPLSRYRDVLSKNVSKELFTNGAYRFVIGLNKKVLIANVLANVTNEIYATPFESLSTTLAWIGSISYSLQLFFDFSGYSDMAIGLSEMFGYTCKENFNYPYMTESVTKFWRRWHISLSEWFRDYIYIPLGGSKNKCAARVYFNLLVVWLLTGIWHGASWNFVFWGLGYFIVISLERLTKMPERLKTRYGKIIYRIFSIIFINFEWVLFRADGLINGLRFIKRMILPYTNMAANIRSLFLLKDYGFFFALSIVLCFPIVRVLEEKTQNNQKVYNLYETMISLMVIFGFIWAISFVVAGQNNPFAYANF